MPGVRLDFLPQMADMHVQAVLVPVIVRAPDSLANGIIGYDVPAVIGQPLQQGALGGGQASVVPSARRTAASCKLTVQSPSVSTRLRRSSVR